MQDSDTTTRLLNALAYLAWRSSALEVPQATKLRLNGTIEEVEGGLRIADLQPLRKRGLLSIR